MRCKRPRRSHASKQTDKLVELHSTPFVVAPAPSWHEKAQHHVTVRSWPAPQPGGQKKFGARRIRQTGAWWLIVFRLAPLRPQIVPWSTLCRADWVRNDLVLTMRGWLLRHYHPGDCSQPVMALLGPQEMSDLSPQSGGEFNQSVQHQLQSIGRGF